MDSGLALLLYMDLIATACKTGNPIAEPYLAAEAIEIMPDGVAIYRQDRFVAVMADQVAKL
jgi:hypothetical protein